MSARKRGLPASCLVPPAAAFLAWGELGEPFHGPGLLALLGFGAVLGTMAPGVVASLVAVPLALVPVPLRRWWRRGQDHRPAIPRALRRAVYAADRHRCCWCHAQADLQVDHIRPWSAGGLSVLWNLMTLCGRCNRIKSNYWSFRDGTLLYQPFPGLDNPHLAADILRHERRARWSPARLVRAGWGLAA